MPDRDRLDDNVADFGCLGELSARMYRHVGAVGIDRAARLRDVSLCKYLRELRGLDAIRRESALRVSQLHPFGQDARARNLFDVR